MPSTLIDCTFSPVTRGPVKRLRLLPPGSPAGTARRMQVPNGPSVGISVAKLPSAATGTLCCTVVQRTELK